eukprot:4114537-Prymnesium_polylepis.3
MDKLLEACVAEVQTRVKIVGEACTPGKQGGCQIRTSCTSGTHGGCGLARGRPLSPIVQVGPALSQHPSQHRPVTQQVLRPSPILGVDDDFLLSDCCLIADRLLIEC